MHRYPIGRRSVISDIEDVVLAVIERRRSGRLRSQHFFLFLCFGNQVKITSRNLAAKIISIDSFSDAEVHANTSLARGVRPARTVNVFLGEEASAARLRFDLPTFFAESFGHRFDAESFIDRVLNELTRLLDAEDLHRPASVFISCHVDKGQPYAARGDAVTVEQPGMEREEQFRRGGKHDADIHEPLD